MKARLQTQLRTLLLAALPVVRGAALVVALVAAGAAVAANRAEAAVTVAVVWFRMEAVVAVRLPLSIVRRSWTLCSSPSPHHVWRHNGSYRLTPTDTGEALERGRRGEGGEEGREGRGELRLCMGTIPIFVRFSP